MYASKDWKDFDVEMLLKGMLYSMTPNIKMTDNRFRHSINVSELSCRILKHVYPSISEDEYTLFKYAAMLHDCCKGAANADTGQDHGVLASAVIRSVFGKTAIQINSFQYELIMDAVSEHSNKFECLRNSYNKYLISLIFGDMLDHVCPDYAKLMREYGDEVGVDVEGYVNKKHRKIAEAIEIFRQNKLEEVSEFISVVEQILSEYKEV